MWPSNITMSSVDLLHELDVFTTRVKTKTVPVLGYSTSNVIVQHKSLQRHYKLYRNDLCCTITFDYSFFYFSIVITHFFIFCCTCSQIFYCTNSIENDNKKDKYSRNSFTVNMVWEDMESLPIINIIGTLVQNFLQLEHNLCLNRTVNFQDHDHYHYVMA